MDDATTDGLRLALERASRAQAGGAAAGESIQVLSFALSDEWHGLRLADLVEIIGGVEPTPVPFTPAWIPGVINHRGSIVAVVDLKRILGLPSRFRKHAGRIVLASVDGTVVGFEVDEISDIVDVLPAALEPPPRTLDPARAAFLEGCVQRPRGLLVVLSLPALARELRSRPGP